MNKARLIGALCFAVFSAITGTAHAVPVSSQGTWETTLQGRDLDGNAATIEAYYDTTLDITWLADANAAGTTMNWLTADGWTSGLDVNGITGWRLPTNTPVNGTGYVTSLSTDGTTDRGTAATTTDGTDGGWRNSSTPVSEMGHMYYVTLGNLGLCDPDEPWCATQTGLGLSNTGPFSNIQSSHYWSGSNVDTSDAWNFHFNLGSQLSDNKDSISYAWAVRSGDVSAVPVPAAVWLFGSGLFGLLGLARHKR